MRVLLTGAFGNIGESTLIALLERDIQVKCFDIRTESTEKTAKRLGSGDKFEVVWGDIRDSEAVEKMMQGMDAVVHLAAIIPPSSEKNAELAKEVNVGGTKNIISGAESTNPKPKLIFASSVSIFGPTMHLEPPRRASDPVNPTDTYTHTKVECEKLVRESDLQWTILRFTAVPPLEVGSSEIDDSLFQIPLDQRIEFVHTRDVGVACANAVTAEIEGKILLIGGGEKNQMLQRGFIGGLLEGMGIGMLPESAFKQPKKPEDWYYTDWLDTEESQGLLKYQKRTYEEFLDEFKKKMGFRRYLAKLFSGQARKRMLEASPYYEED
jgi:nucleoside-diphosphate-sugar epimerase